MAFGDPPEPIKGTEPSSSYRACGIVVPPVQNASQAKLLPTPPTAKQSIIGDQDTIDPQSTRPFVPSQRLIKVLTFNNTIGLRKDRNSNFLKIQRKASLFRIIFPTFPETLPLPALQIQVHFSPCLLDMLSRHRKSLVK